MNNNIQEHYCSFQVSKLLKEKGFDIECSKFYNNEGWNFNVGEHEHSFANNTELNGRGFSRPTHALAIEWIKVNFGFWIYVKLISDNNWLFDVSIDIFSFRAEKGFSSPQEATEAALLYTLKNLIN